MRRSLSYGRDGSAGPVPQLADGQEDPPVVATSVAEATMALRPPSSYLRALRGTMDLTVPANRPTKLRTSLSEGSLDERHALKYPRRTAKQLAERRRIVVEGLFPPVPANESSAKPSLAAFERRQENHREHAAEAHTRLAFFDGSRTDRSKVTDFERAHIALRRNRLFTPAATEHNPRRALVDGRDARLSMVVAAEDYHDKAKQPRQARVSTDEQRGAPHTASAHLHLCVFAPLLLPPTLQAPGHGDSTSRSGGGGGATVTRVS